MELILHISLTTMTTFPGKILINEKTKLVELAIKILLRCHSLPKHPRQPNGSF